jgi:hypothetical protein
MNLEKVNHITLGIHVYLNRLFLAVNFLVVLFIFVAWLQGAPIETVRVFLLIYLGTVIKAYIFDWILTDWYYRGFTNIFGLVVKHEPSWFLVGIQTFVIVITIYRLFEIVNMFSVVIN